MLSMEALTPRQRHVQALTQEQVRLGHEVARPLRRRGGAQGAGEVELGRGEGGVQALAPEEAGELDGELAGE
jgi:hypothetical protein